jgi:hypothetical protein
MSFLSQKSIQIYCCLVIAIRNFSRLINFPLKSHYITESSIMHKFLVSALILLSFSIYADEAEILTVDRVIPSNIGLSFPNDNNTKPKLGDFKLIHYVVMSNDIGERWAVITLNNTSTGTRTLVSDHLIALFANGERTKPSEFRLSFGGEETQSITVSFGKNKFPILSIITRS